MILSNKTYEFLKRLVQVVFPGVGTLYFALGAIWGLPYADQVVGTLAALATFLGLVVGISNSQYKDLKAMESEKAQHFGALVFTRKDDGSLLGSLDFAAEPEDLLDMSHVTFQIVDQTKPIRPSARKAASSKKR